MIDLMCELGINKILNEIKNHEVENNYEIVNIVFYMIDGDKISYFLKTFFETVVYFVFFFHQMHLFLMNISPLKENFVTYVTLVVNFVDEKSAISYG